MFVFRLKKKEESPTERLERLFQSANPIERGQAAWDGYKFDILIDDPHSYVRMCVADSFYGLDKLISDRDPLVAAHVQRLLDTFKMTLEEWVQKNPYKCALKENKKYCPCCKVKFDIVGARYCPFCGTDLEKGEKSEN